jgi:hypothetical protein
MYLVLSMIWKKFMPFVLIASLNSCISSENKPVHLLTPVPNKYINSRQKNNHSSGTLTIARDGGVFAGSAASVHVSVDGCHLATLGTKERTTIRIAPGRKIITAKAITALDKKIIGTRSLEVTVTDDKETIVRMIFDSNLRLNMWLE